jgi:hypothetical protein
MLASLDVSNLVVGTIATRDAPYVRFGWGWVKST